MVTKPTSVSGIIELWPNSEAFADDLGLKRGGDHARVMKVRGSIPRDHWPRVLDGAARRKLPVTQRTLELAHANKQARAS